MNFKDILSGLGGQGFLGMLTGGGGKPNPIMDSLGMGRGFLQMLQNPSPMSGLGLMSGSKPAPMGAVGMKPEDANSDPMGFLEMLWKALGVR